MPRSLFPSELPYPSTVPTLTRERSQRNAHLHRHQPIPRLCPFAEEGYLRVSRWRFSPRDSAVAGCSRNRSVFPQQWHLASSTPSSKALTSIFGVCVIQASPCAASRFFQLPQNVQTKSCESPTIPHAVTRPGVCGGAGVARRRCLRRVMAQRGLGARNAFDCLVPIVSRSQPNHFWRR